MNGIDDISPEGIELSDEELRMASGGGLFGAKDKTAPILNLRLNFRLGLLAKKKPKDEPPPEDTAPNGDKITNPERMPR